MSKIKNINLVKGKLQLGEVRASLVWSYDRQEKLKGNSVIAFEKDLKRICDFDILKRGREKIYFIKEIFMNTLEKVQHGNKNSLKGNKNKEGCCGFNEHSISKFVASVIINKIEYFEMQGGNSYKTISQHMNSFGLFSEKHEQVNNTIRSSFIYALNKMEKLGYVDVKILYCKVVYGEKINITQGEYDNIKKIERDKFKEMVSEDDFKRYKCVYNYSVYSKSFRKSRILYSIREATGVDYIYKMYLIKIKKDMNLAFNERYVNLVLEVFNYGEDSYLEENTQKNISEFVACLEENYKSKLIEYEERKAQNRQLSSLYFNEGFEN